MSPVDPLTDAITCLSTFVGVEGKPDTVAAWSVLLHVLGEVRMERDRLRVAVEDMVTWYDITKGAAERLDVAVNRARAVRRPLEGQDG